MPRAPLLTDDEIAFALRAMPGWERRDDTIKRRVELPTFPSVIALVNRVADAAEAANHHPDIDIRWRSVTFTLTTHAAHGLTHRDVELARRIDELAAEQG